MSFSVVTYKDGSRKTVSEFQAASIQAAIDAPELATVKQQAYIETVASVKTYRKPGRYRPDLPAYYHD